jgi:hypothetical protein
MRKCWIILFAPVLGYDTFSGKLICWVHAVLIPLAQIGIDANPVDCILWAGMGDIRRLRRTARKVAFSVSCRRLRRPGAELLRDVYVVCI